MTRTKPNHLKEMAQQLLQDGRTDINPIRGFGISSFLETQLQAAIKPNAVVY
jgi:hypothetical protein